MNSCDVHTLTVKLGLRKTKADVNRLIQGGGLSVNGEKVSLNRDLNVKTDLIHGRWIAIRAGKKFWAIVEVIA